MWYRFVLLLCSIVSFSASSIQISSLYLTADDTNTATFTVTNTDDKRIFLNIGVYELHMEDGEIVKIPYTRENLSQWQVNIKPSRTIIEPGFKKEFKVARSCGAECTDVIEDQIFQLAVVPTPYFDERSRPKQAVQMAIGFAPVFIVPGTGAPMEYDATYDDGQLTVFNRGKNVIDAVVRSSQCKKGQDSCRIAFKVMPQRRFSIPLKTSVASRDIIIALGMTQTDERIELTLRDPS
ncbi:hypothetical protein [Vibrio sp. F13]|uniref:hypothetical protein n=1 Tax=Vibrio sp. F13 TaxID=2070777 RepID=UPI0010BDDC13|nr:hypothetical protein [Vibrio sp. F13]TKG09029.1 hypothetical protein FCV67_07925 [Vibrio sp. F13]